LCQPGSRTEELCGYSRAVRVGNFVCVAGTTAIGPEGPVGGSDIAAQTREVLDRIGHALAEAGATLDHVVRTRVFVTDMSAWEEIGSVHKAYFVKALPASAIYEVTRLVDPRALIEIEADAIVALPAASGCQRT
jgi:enamine deaminase RidA (YjgF/YER057c/UK114 family)